MARSFNGTTDALNGTIANVAPWTTGVMRGISAWIKCTGTTGGICCSDNGTNRIMQFKEATNKLNLIMFSGGTARSLTGATSINTGAWLHVGGTYDSTTTTLTVYVNGVSDGT